MRGIRTLLAGAFIAAAAGLFGMSGEAKASLIADGITYTLTESIVNSTTYQFTLDITGINGASDTEKGRSGVQSFALTDPGPHVASITPPSGFSLQSGGLNANGCDGSGNFFCTFAQVTPPDTPALAANSSLRAVPKTHAVICRSNRAPVMNSAASKVMVRDIPVLPS